MNATIAARTVSPTGRGESADAYLAVMNALADSFEQLSPAQWALDTECTGWTVRDMAGHLCGAQEDLSSVPALLWRRLRGRRRYPKLLPLDATNQMQIDDHAGETTTQLCTRYRANTKRVARYIRRFPKAAAGIAVDKTMAPGNAPLRLGYLLNVIYLRDAWMHGVDLAHATGQQWETGTADAAVLGQILRDTATVWGAEPAVELELTGELAAGRGSSAGQDGGRWRSMVPRPVGPGSRLGSHHRCGGPGTRQTTHGTADIVLSEAGAVPQGRCA